MEGFSLQSLNLTALPSSFPRGGPIEKPSGHIDVLKFSDFTRHPHAAKVRKLKICSTRAQASGSAKSTSAEAMPVKVDSKDDNLVFVAGATGRVGSRTVRELLKLDFRVRAGVRNAQRADTLIQSVKQMKVDATNAREGGQPVKRLEIVECDLEKPDGIVSALGNASVVICSIGASEKEVFDVTGPYRIDYMATKNLIDAATSAKVNHFILVTSLGTNKVGFPAALLNLFWGVLIWKRKAEEALLASGLPYTIVRPGGMERPTDSFKETHNITLSKEDTLFGGLVSNLQIAELMAVMAKNRDLSYCKIVEVIAETTAPLIPMEELLAKIPSQSALPEKLDVAAAADPGPSDSIVAVVPSISTQKDSVEPKPMVKQALSPYIVYEDLKPPTSPSPTPPNVSNDKPPAASTLELASISTESAAAENASDGQHLAEPKSRPLSPYTMYEDLKPPASPTPSVKKF